MWFGRQHLQPSGPDTPLEFGKNRGERAIDGDDHHAAADDATRCLDRASRQADCWRLLEQAGAALRYQFGLSTATRQRVDHGVFDHSDAAPKRTVIPLDGKASVTQRIEVLATVALILRIVREAQVADATRDRGETKEDPLALQDRRRIHPGGAINAVRGLRLMVKERRSRPQQTAVPAGRRAAHATGVHADYGNAFATQSVDARQPATTKANYTNVGLRFAGENRMRRAMLSVPDRSVRRQKYVAKEASSLAKSLRLLN